MKIILALLALLSLQAHAEVATPKSTVVVHTVETESGPTAATIEVLGDEAKKIFDFLARSKKVKREELPPEMPRWPKRVTLNGPSIRCSVPGLTSDLAIYACRIYVDSQGNLWNPSAEQKEIYGKTASHEQGSPSAVSVRLTSKGNLEVAMSGSAAHDLQFALTNSGYASSARKMSNSHLGCVYTEFPSDVPRVMGSCGFQLDPNGEAVRR